VVIGVDRKNLSLVRLRKWGKLKLLVQLNIKGLDDWRQTAHTL
jgi:hypothetical protein